MVVEGLGRRGEGKGDLRDHRQREGDPRDHRKQREQHCLLYLCHHDQQWEVGWRGQSPSGQLQEEREENGMWGGVCEHMDWMGMWSEKGMGVCECRGWMGGGV